MLKNLEDKLLTLEKEKELLNHKAEKLKNNEKDDIFPNVSPPVNIDNVKNTTYLKQNEDK